MTGSPSASARRILFLGFLADENVLEEAFAAEANPQVAALKFQLSLIEGLTLNGAHISVLSALPISTYPRNPLLFVRSSTFSMKPNILGYQMGGINLPGVRLVSRLITSSYFTIKKLLSADKPDGIFVYSLHTPFLAAAVIARLIFRIPIYVTINDLPMFMSGEQPQGIRAVAKMIDDKLLKFLVKFIAVALPVTKDIAKDWLPISVKYLVVECISSQFISSSLQRKNRHYESDERSIKRMLYTGHLANVWRFAQLFSINSDIQAALIFVGDGPEAANLIELGKIDPRIQVKPFMSGEDLKQEVQAADFLVNPRDTRWPGSKYSFPSKVMDYMRCARPIISTKLSGIPEEYFECFLAVDDGSPETFKASLLNAITTSCEELERRIHVGESFLRGEKSVSRIGAKIMRKIDLC